MEHMDAMVTTLLHYKIIPIFVFDGKPPQEKKTLLQQRRELKREAEGKYKDMLQQIEYGLDETEEMSTQLATLKKQFLKVDQNHIQCVKSILRQYQVEFVDAPGESDELCVQYVKSRRAWACLTNDMDMFVYGTNRVLRDFSLTAHSVDLYVMSSILADLNMDMKTFRQIMVLSGTDYNPQPPPSMSSSSTTISLHETMKWFYEYKKYIKYRNHHHGSYDFYEWLLKYTKYIQDYSKLTHIYDMFDI
jgi:5'-3' exonuclease